MCGISGQYCFKGSPDNDLLIEMTNRIFHRGPDDYGRYITNKICLDHRRLSIIDLSKDGHQPMSNETNDIFLIYNGEIYNYLDLRNDLIKKGHKFKSHTDTEVIIHAYEEWGYGCLDYLEGMWSFALWDERKKRLFCSRDRFGIKPFYYAVIDDSFLFASEIKSLLAHPKLGKEPNIENLNIFLSSGILDYNENTMFKNIYQIKPSHSLIIDDKGLHHDRYYYINVNPDITSNIHDISAASKFMLLLKKSVKSHLNSDVPVGTCLSGGIDSSTIVKLIEIIKIITCNNEKQMTFSSRFSDKRFDEGEYIDIINNQTKTISYCIEPNPKTLLKDLDNLIYVQEEPFGSLSIYAQYCVMQLANGKVKVLLDGQGADELLAGYIGYQGNYIKNLFQEKYILTATKEIFGSIYHHYNFYLYALRQLMIRGKRRELLADNNYFFNRYSGKFDQMLYNEAFISNLPSLLHYEDRNSMAFSIESRVPYLDKNFAEYVIKLPCNQKIRNGVTKIILRNAIRNFVPNKIRNRMDKMGFVTPEEEWMKNELKDFIINILNSDSFMSRKYWKGDLVRKNYCDFIQNKSNYSPELWRIICTELWFRKFFE